MQPPHHVDVALVLTRLGWRQEKFGMERVVNHLEPAGFHPRRSGLRLVPESDLPLNRASHVSRQESNRVSQPSLMRVAGLTPLAAPATHQSVHVAVDIVPSLPQRCPAEACPFAVEPTHTAPSLSGEFCATLPLVADRSLFPDFLNSLTKASKSASARALTCMLPLLASAPNLISRLSNRSSTSSSIGISFSGSSSFCARSFSFGHRSEMSRSTPFVLFIPATISSCDVCPHGIARSDGGLLRLRRYSNG
jgi:hypothetical protein